MLDAELAGLPEKWRLPLVLCYLEGRTQDEAAKQLGWSERTLRRRLEEARSALGRRLRRRGLVVPAALSAILFSDCAVSAALPARLVGPTVEAATRIAAGKAGRVMLPAQVVALAEGVLKTFRPWLGCTSSSGSWYEKPRVARLPGGQLQGRS